MNFKKELEKQYEKSFEYIRNSRKHILIIALIFSVFCFLGFVLPLPENISNQILDYFRELVLKTQNYSSFEMIHFLFSNNSFATFMGLFFGIFFGIFSIFSTVINGFILGFAANLSVIENGALSLLRLFPHGIFEIPAVFLALGLGLKLGSFIFQKDRKKILKEYFRNSLRVYILVVLPLLIIAAIIEGLLITISF